MPPPKKPKHGDKWMNELYAPSPEGCGTGEAVCETIGSVAINTNPPRDFTGLISGIVDGIFHADTSVNPVSTRHDVTIDTAPSAPLGPLDSDPKGSCDTDSKDCPIAVNMTGDNIPDTQCRSSGHVLNSEQDVYLNSSGNCPNGTGSDSCDSAGLTTDSLLSERVQTRMSPSEKSIARAGTSNPRVTASFPQPNREESWGSMTPIEDVLCTRESGQEEAGHDTKTCTPDSGTTLSLGNIRVFSESTQNDSLPHVGIQSQISNRIPALENLSPDQKISSKPIKQENVTDMIVIDPDDDNSMSSSVPDNTENCHMHLKTCCMQNLPQPDSQTSVLEEIMMSKDSHLLYFSKLDSDNKGQHARTTVMNTGSRSPEKSVVTEQNCACDRDRQTEKGKNTGSLLSKPIVEITNLRDRQTNTFVTQQQSILVPRRREDLGFRPYTRDLDNQTDVCMSSGSGRQRGFLEIVLSSPTQGIDSVHDSPHTGGYRRGDNMDGIHERNQGTGVHSKIGPTEGPVQNSSNRREAISWRGLCGMNRAPVNSTPQFTCSDQHSGQTGPQYPVPGVFFRPVGSPHRRPAESRQETMLDRVLQDVRKTTPAEQNQDIGHLQQRHSAYLLRQLCPEISTTQKQTPPEGQCHSGYHEHHMEGIDSRSSTMGRQTIRSRGVPMTISSCVDSILNKVYRDEEPVRQVRGVTRDRDSLVREIQSPLRYREVMHKELSKSRPHHANFRDYLQKEPARWDCISSVLTETGQEQTQPIDLSCHKNRQSPPGEYICNRNLTVQPPSEYTTQQTGMTMLTPGGYKIHNRPQLLQLLATPSDGAFVRDRGDRNVLPSTEYNVNSDSCRGWSSSRYGGDQSVFASQQSGGNYPLYSVSKTQSGTQCSDQFVRQNGYRCQTDSDLSTKPLTQPLVPDRWSMDSSPSQPSSQHSPGISSGSLSPFPESLNSERAASCSDSGVEAHTPPLDINNSLETDSSERGRLCQICNDGASGFHYGVWSCEGCKAFFKRSLQGPVDYICPATNTCTIDKHRRKSCQACRLRKCVQMGMSRGSCREKKSYRQHHKQGKRKADPHCDTIPPKQTKFARSPPCNVSSEISPLNIKKEQYLSSETPPSVLLPEVEQSEGKLSALPPMPHPLVQHLMRIEPEERLAENKDLRPDMPLSDLLLPLVDSELRDIVSWAKEVPGYMSLLLTERMELMEQSWSEVLLFGLIMRSTKHHNLLRFASNLQLSEEYARNDELWPICKQATVLVNSCKQLDIKPEEAVLLRSCLLLNAGVHNLAIEDRFQRVQQKVLEALQQTVLVQFRQSVTRITRLLLLLPQLRQLGLLFNRILVRLQQQGRLPASCKLIGELLKTSANYHSNI